jgi:preprotein translocase subunit SecA
MTFPIPLRAEDLEAKSGNAEDAATFVFEKVKEAYDLKISLEDPNFAAVMERQILLQHIDSHWQDYLRAMDALRQGVGLRAYGQQDPLVEYRREAYTMFEDLMSSIKQDISNAAFRSTTSARSFESFMASLPKQLVHDGVSLLGGGQRTAAPASMTGSSGEVSASMHEEALDAAIEALAPVRREGPKVGRNDPCPCGSGKKFKKCCGK